MTILDQPSLAIIIDCWPEQTFSNLVPSRPIVDYRKCMQNIKNFCQEDSNIKAIALATYGSGKASNSKWYKQAEDFFMNETRWDTLRDHWVGSIKNQDTDNTDPAILDMELRNDQVGFTAVDNLQILYYCNSINPSIRNIYFFGAYWDRCIKDRPVGWQQVSLLNQYNLFKNQQNLLTRKDCVISIDDVFFNIGSPWTKINSTTNILEKL